MENSIAQKLDALKKLQSIDSELDDIKKLRGDLPEEVRDLEDEIAGYETRIDKLKLEQSSFEDTIKDYKNKIKENEKRISVLEEQKNNVRNNREFSAISSDLETLDLDNQLANKRIKEAKVASDSKREQLLKTKELLESRKQDLSNKKKELEEIMRETAIEEDKLAGEREEAGNNLDERLFKAYSKLRENASNGLAVVSVKRGACGGCFNMVPPQRQAEIRERKKLIVCEHCGRVLTDVVDIVIPEEETTSVRKKLTRKKLGDA